MRAYPDTISMEIHCATAGHWNKLPDKSYAKLCKIRINSVDILDSGSDKINAFISKFQCIRIYYAIQLMKMKLNKINGNEICFLFALP